MRELTRALQDELCSALEIIDGTGKFHEDAWTKEGNSGGGRSRVMKNGSVFEQGGCNWSEVTGTSLPPSILAKHPHLAGKTFRATGVSLVLHPRNPHCPTVHLNYRYFEAGDFMADGGSGEGNVWWLGGGMDLTPYYLYEEDAKFFHTEIKRVCDAHDPSYYPIYSRWANAYFFIKHRKEHRGIGGLFFDYLDTNNTTSLYRAEEKSYEYSKELADFALGHVSTTSKPRTFDELRDFAASCARLFLPVYGEIIGRRRETAYTESERNWQLYRRGRYVEFNLVYDRGTVFGLQTQGRVESILMSLPPMVRFEYDYTPEPLSREDAMWQVNLKARDWVA